MLSGTRIRGDFIPNDSLLLGTREAYAISWYRHGRRPQLVTFWPVCKESLQEVKHLRFGNINCRVSLRSDDFSQTGNLVRLNSSDSRDGARAHMFVLEVVLERAHESNGGPGSRLGV
jgi:hypothetical protein